jgi:hypothetical protein
VIVARLVEVPTYNSSFPRLRQLADHCAEMTQAEIEQSEERQADYTFSNWQCNEKD